jgi:hypothetical protein
MKLSETQMMFLIDHVEQNTIRPYGSNKNEDQTRNALLDMKLIRETKEGTVTTPLGRDMKCAILARWADALTRAGYKFDDRGQLNRMNPSAVAAFYESHDHE